MKELKIKWCSQCETFYVECPVCGNNLCNGGGGACCGPFYILQEKLIKCDAVRIGLISLDWDKTIPKSDWLNEMELGDEIRPL